MQENDTGYDEGVTFTAERLNSISPLWTTATTTATTEVSKRMPANIQRPFPITSIAIPARLRVTRCAAANL